MAWRRWCKGERVCPDAVNAPMGVPGDEDVCGSRRFPPLSLLDGDPGGVTGRAVGGGSQLGLSLPLSAAVWLGAPRRSFSFVAGCPLEKTVDEEAPCETDRVGADERSLGSGVAGG